MTEDFAEFMKSRSWFRCVCSVLRLQQFLRAAAEGHLVELVLSETSTAALELSDVVGQLLDRLHLLLQVVSLDEIRQLKGRNQTVVAQHNFCIGFTAKVSDFYSCNSAGTKPVVCGFSSHR